MSEIFLFNSPPRSGNVFLTYLFPIFVDGQLTTKSSDMEKYSDENQKQAAFFRNPYDTISSWVVKSRIELGNGFDNKNDLEYNIQFCAQEYLEAIKEAKANFSKIYLGKSEDMMVDPISKIKDVSLFFNFTTRNDNELTINQIEDRIRIKMINQEKHRIDKDGNEVVENLMTNHGGHMPREKIKDRLYLDELLKQLDFNILKECYNEYISIESTSASEGQRW